MQLFYRDFFLRRYTETAYAIFVAFSLVVEFFPLNLFLDLLVHFFPERPSVHSISDFRSIIYEFEGNVIIQVDMSIVSLSKQQLSADANKLLDLFLGHN